MPTVVDPPPETGGDKPPKPDTGGQPKRRGAGGRPAGRANAASVERIETALNDLFTSGALAFQLSGNDVGCVILLSRGPKVANAWAELARQNANVRRVLEKLMEGGAWGGVIISTASMAIPLIQSYDRWPEGVPMVFGLAPEEVAKVRELQMAREAFMQNRMSGENGSS